MLRRPLKTLDETLARKVAIRRGWVYIKRAASGPPPPKTDKEEAIDDLIRDTAVAFDFSPVLSGDRVQSQKVADDFIRELERAVSADESLAKPSREDLEARLLVVWPHLWRSLNAFRDRLRTAVQQQQPKPAANVSSLTPTRARGKKVEPGPDDQVWWGRRPKKGEWTRGPKPNEWRRKPGPTTSQKRQAPPRTWSRDPQRRR